MRSLVMSECSLSGRGQGHVSNFYIVDLQNFAKSSVDRWYTQLDRRRFVFDTYKTMKATRTPHGWVHMFTTHRPTLIPQLHDFDLFRTCRTALLRGNWQDFNSHDASRGPSVIAELLVLLFDFNCTSTFAVCFTLNEWMDGWMDEHPGCGGVERQRLGADWQAREMVFTGRVPADVHRLQRRPRQRLAIPLPLLQERRRSASLFLCHINISKARMRVIAASPYRVFFSRGHRSCEFGSRRLKTVADGKCEIWARSLSRAGND